MRFTVAPERFTIVRSAALDRPEPLVIRFFRFVRACIVGGGATIVDVSVLTTCIRLLDLAPRSARVPALLAGASVQFFGNRTFTFRAQAGKIGRQAMLFLVAEAVALAMNLALYWFLVPRVHFIPPEPLSFAGTFVVFVTFAYPMRRLVIFKLPQA